MNWIRRIALALGLAVVASLGGCVVSLGGSDSTKVVRPSVGAELEDLKKALDAGAITEAEYETLKKRVLDRSAAKEE